MQTSFAAQGERNCMSQRSRPRTPPQGRRPDAKSPVRAASSTVGGSRRSLGRFAFPVALGSLIAAGLVLRWLLADRNTFPNYDGVFYMEQARALVSEGRLPFSTFPPGWPLLFTPILMILGLDDPAAPLRAAQALNVVLGAGFGWLTYLALARGYGRSVGLAAAAIVLFLPLSLHLSRIELSDMSGACALTGAWLFWERGRRWLTGLLLGYAYLIRPEMLLVVVALQVHEWKRTGRIGWRTGFGAMIIVVPYLLFLRVATGQWLLSSKAVFVQEAIAGLSFAALASRTLHNAGVFSARAVQVLGWSLAALAIVGLVRRPGRWLLFLVPVTIIPFFSFNMEPRFWLPYFPFLLLAAASGFQSLQQWAPSVARRYVTPAVSVLVLGSVIAILVRDYPLVANNQEAYIGLKEAGLTLRSRVTRDAVIASYKPYSSFWAWCEFTKIPDGESLPAILAAVENAGARYLVVDAKTVGDRRSVLQPLLVPPLPDEFSRQLALVGRFTFPDAPLQNTAIFLVRANEAMGQ
ncbi:MAG: hypothetical protein IPJ24_00505 [bacterium]|nr:hypothetical protein [bacterium]